MSNLGNVILFCIFLAACILALFVWSQARAEKAFINEFHYWYREMFGISPLFYMEKYALDLYHEEEISPRNAAYKIGTEEGLHVIAVE